MKLILAHRLHANILAYSYDVPHVGLTWDKKMDAFFQMTEREMFLLEGAMSNTEIIVKTLVNALSEKFDSRVHASMLAGAKTGIEYTAHSLLERAG
ncbi:polysaccharide pyruvyl transferase family protein [Opitutales bacterium]|nr:polysaccharide pyruvyl transferase family protein [Opitutales bacterium]